MSAVLMMASLTLATEPCGDWTLVETPNPGTTFNYLNGVARLGTDNALTIGRDGQGEFALKFDGNSWFEIPIPTPGQVGSAYSLSAVGNTPAGNAWAVGIAYLNQFESAPVVMRHNGLGWDNAEAVVLEPSGRTAHALAVSARAEDDAWAVGISSGAGGNGGSPPLAIHWDGGEWTEIMPPTVGDRQNNLYGVSALETDDVWAVGDFQNSIQQPLGFYALTFHWDGSSWSEVPNPGYSIPSASLRSVAMVAADDVWASGSSNDGVLLMHWNGMDWSVVAAPATNGFSARALTVLAADDIWATTGLEFLHWDGSAWEVVPPAEVPGATGFSLGHMARMGPCDLWAAGSYQPVDGPYARTLAQRFELGATSIPETTIQRRIIFSPSAYPNPFRAQTSISFGLAKDSLVRLNIFDVSGRRIRSLANRSYSAGEHIVPFDGSELTAGVYFARLETPEQAVVARLSICR